MVSLKTLLSSLEGRPTARLELMSGRRPRLVFDDDGRGPRGEVKNLADEALTEDEVMSFCEAAGGGRKLETIDRGPIAWQYATAGSTYQVTAELRGREIAATFAHGETRGANQRQQPGSVSSRPSRRSQAVVKPIAPRNDRDVRSRRPSPIDRGSTGRVSDKPGAARPRSRELYATSTSPAKPMQERVHDRPPAEQGSTARRATPAPRAAPVPPPRDAMATQAQPTSQFHHGHPLAGGAAPAAQRRATPRPPPFVPPATGLVAITKPRWPAEHATVTRFVNLLLEGHRMGASDLHLVPRQPAIFRVGGALAPTRETFPAQETEKAILSLVPEQLRETFEARGGADFALEVPKLGRFRVSVSLTLRGLKAALRFLPRDAPTLEALGLPSRLREATAHHQGLVVVTGPTGHGKTTTLAALVDHLNATTTHHIITVEDPVEIVHSIKKAIVSQREVGSHTQSFARALKGALRQDPDVIVVGELRDTETVRMALSASETGHLVLGTMNTPSAAATIEALIDLFPPGDQAQVRATLAGGLKYIVSQRLVRNVEGTGRVVALETLPGSLPLSNLIRDQKTYQLPSLMQRGKGMGVVRLNESLAQLVESGAVKAADAIYASDSPEELEALLKGEPRKEDAPAAQTDLVGGLLERAGAFFSRKGGD